MRSERIQIIITAILILTTLVCATLTALSLTRGQLYSPVGIVADEGSGIGFYIGIAIYITIGATSLTSSLIRIALRLTR